MATRPLLEPAEYRFAPYIEELHECLATYRIPFGAPEDLDPTVARIRQPGAFAEDLSSLVRSFILRQGGAMPQAELMGILSFAIAGPEISRSPLQHSESLRQLLAFVSGIMRRPWNVPPGERAEIVPFPSESTQAFEIDSDSAPFSHPSPEAAQPAAPTHETSVPHIEHPAPPVSAISAALAAESERVARPHPEPLAIPAPPTARRPEPVPESPPSTVQNHSPEQEVHPVSRDRPRTHINSSGILIATPATLVLCAVLVIAFRSHKPASNDPAEQAQQPLPPQTISQPVATPQPVTGVPVSAAAAATGPPKPSADGSQLTPRHSPRTASGSSEPDIAEPYSSSPQYAPAHVFGRTPGPASQQQATPLNIPSPVARPNSPANSAPAGQSPAPVVRQSAVESSHVQVPQPLHQPTLRDPDAGYVGEYPASSQRPTTERLSSFNVSSGVMAANLISAPEPEYPTFARIAHVQGQVILQAVIARDGSVSNTHVLRGNRLLRGAAQDAVRRWRYRPYRVNGHAVDVATIITVEFHRLN